MGSKLEVAHSYGWNGEEENPEIDYVADYYYVTDKMKIYKNRPFIWVYPFIKEWNQDDGDQIIKHTLEISPEESDSYWMGIKITDTYSYKSVGGSTRHVKEESIWFLDTSKNLLLDKNLWEKNGTGYQLLQTERTIRADE